MDGAARAGGPAVAQRQVLHMDRHAAGDVEDAAAAAAVDDGAAGAVADQDGAALDLEIAVGGAGGGQGVGPRVQQDDVLAGILVGGRDRLAQRAVGIADAVVGVGRFIGDVDRRLQGGR